MAGADFASLIPPRLQWMADALCREHPEVNFFHGQGEDVEPPKAVCGECLVSAECRAYARVERIPPASGPVRAAGPPGGDHRTAGPAIGPPRRTARAPGSVSSSTSWRVRRPSGGGRRRRPGRNGRADSPLSAACPQRVRKRTENVEY